MKLIDQVETVETADSGIDSVDSKRPSQQSIDLHSHVFDDEYQIDLDETIETIRSDGRKWVYYCCTFLWNTVLSTQF